MSNENYLVNLASIMAQGAARNSSEVKEVCRKMDKQAAEDLSHSVAIRRGLVEEPTFGKLLGGLVEIGVRGTVITGGAMVTYNRTHSQAKAMKREIERGITPNVSPA